MRRDNDIKAPDGYLLGGLRLVRKDGSVLFQRGWWQCPVEWAGEMVWLHEWSDLWGNNIAVEAWPPGVRIWQHKIGETVILERTERPDAKPGYRRADHKAWHERVNA